MSTKSTESIFIIKTPVSRTLVGDNGILIKGRIAESIKDGISETLARTNDSIEFIEVKAIKNEDGIVEPHVRFALCDYGKEIILGNILNGDECKKYQVKAVTLCFPNETSGIRLRVDKSGTKIYEVFNGSYQMNLKWFVHGKECMVKIIIHDDSPVELVEGSGVTMEELAANDIKIGVECEAKPLCEALKSLLQ